MLTLLPDELLLKIFGYLSSYQIMKTIAFVCKDFYRLSQESSLFTNIYLGPKMNKSCEEYSNEVLSRSSHLNKLILEEIENADHIIYTLNQSWSKLTYLEIIQCHISEECFDILIQSVPKIQHLSLRGTCIRQKMRNLTKLDHLKYLNLSGYNYKFDSTDLTNLAYNCKKLANLKIDWVCMYLFLTY